MNLQRFYDVSQATDLASFERQLRAFAEEMGFPLFSAWMVLERPETGAKPVVASVHNTPAAFEAMSNDPGDAQRDPVIHRLKTLSVPFIYDQSLYVSEGVADLWESQAAHGYQTGISVALHLPGHKHFILGFDRDQPLPSDEPQLVRMMADLQLMAVHAQAAADRLLLKAEVDQPRTRLTARETEILQWTRAGKSAWQTGAILGISEATVNFHLRNVCGKLGVASKHQAVLKALSQGLMS